MSIIISLPVIDATAPAKPNKQRRSGPPAPQTPLEMIEAQLVTADLILINSSGGKDSQTALEETVLTCDRLGIPRSRLVVVHADLGESEWKGTKELAEAQAKHYGLAFTTTHYLSKKGARRTLLAHIIQRGRWPDSNNRYCTSDFKRNPVMRVMTRYARAGGWGLRLQPGQHKMKIVNVLGMRAEESDARKLLPNWSVNKPGTNGVRETFNWLPIFRLTLSDVWSRIKASGVPYHCAYDLGMPRLSCCFCIFSPKSALMLAGKHNRELLAAYVKAEAQMGHKFKANLALADVQKAIEAGEECGPVSDWQM